MMSVGVIILPYIIPMLLGRTFDIFTSQVGVDIFPQSAITTPILIERSFVSSDFKVIRNDSEARQFLGVSDDLSLRVKAGVLHIAATGDYLRDVQTRENYVEILVKSQYETVSETLHGSVEPITDWDLQSPTYLGTHFVRTVTYGGMLLASLRLYVSDQRQKDAVESLLRKYFSYSTMDVGVDHAPGEVIVRQEYHSFEDKLKRVVYAAEEKVGKGMSVQIKYYSTVTAPYVPQDIDSFLRLLEDFPAEAEKLNGGKGVPLKVELVPLHELSARMIALRPNKYLEKTLEDMDYKFNDLLLTHAEIRKMSERTKPEDYKENCEVHDLGSDIHGKLDVFKDVIRRLDTASPSSLFETKRAIQAYEQKDEPDKPWGYYKKLKEIEDHAEKSGHLVSASKSTDSHNKNKVNINTFDHSTNDKQASHTGNSLQPKTNFLTTFSPLDHFGYLAEMSMANGVCASLNKFSGNFLTLRRNCTVSGITCGAMCWSLQDSAQSSQGGQGSRTTQQGGECVGVVVAELHVSQEVAVGARTINLGRNACDRTQCYHEYCCCRMGGRIGIL